MKIVLLSSLICIGLFRFASGEVAAPALMEQAAQIVIGPTLGSKFDPATEAVARITDNKIIRQVLETVVGKEPQEVDHIMMLPHLQVAVLNAKGEVIATFALDRTPSKKSQKALAVIRITEVVKTDGKETIDFKELFKGFPCKALEAYRFEDEEYPKAKSDQGGAGQSTDTQESKSEGGVKPLLKTSPAEDALNKAKPVEVDVAVDADGALKLNGKAIVKQELVAALKKLKADAEAKKLEILLTIIPEERTKYERVTEVLDAVTLAGVTNVSFQVAVPKDKKE